MQSKKVRPDTKFCKDCKYLTTDERFLTQKCKHENNQMIDLVTGKSYLGYEPHNLRRLELHNETLLCGPNGDWFESKD